MKTKKRHVFKCTECQNERIECVQKNVDITSKIISIHEDDIEYAPANVHDDAQEITFQCDKCGFVIAHSDEELRLKLEQEYYVANSSFVDGLMIVMSDKTEKDMRKSVIRYLKNKGIEIEEK